MVAAALAEPDLNAAMGQLVSLLLEHAGGRLADDVLLVLGEPGMPVALISTPTTAKSTLS